jgi:hypothetical protein
MCKKNAIEIDSTTSSNSKSISGNQLAGESKFAIFNDVNHFEQQVNRFISMDDAQMNGIKDSLRNVEIYPLSDYLNEEDESYEGLERIADILNKDGIIQVGDSIIRICKNENIAYILTPADTNYLQQLRQGILIDNYIYLHTNLEQPIFDLTAEEEGGDVSVGKRGLFCRDAWAQAKEDIDESWDGYVHGVHLPSNNDVLGVRWKVRYNAAGVWFTLFVNARVCRFRNNAIDFNTGEYRGLRRFSEEVSFRKRCGNSSNWTAGSITFDQANRWGTTHHSSPRALQRYDYKFWAEHTSHNHVNSSQPFRCYKWPLHIQNN